MSFLRVHPRAKSAWFIPCWLVVALVLSDAASYAARHYRIGFSPEVEQSLDSRYFLVKLGHAAPARDTYIAFSLPKRLQRFPAGTWFVKRLVGLPGDVVQVGVSATRVNGKVVAGPLDSAQVLGLKPENLVRTFIVPPDKVFVVGTQAHSYDSRYWGTLAQSQIVGSAVLL